ncbi:MAG: ECF transporter S component [Clostridiales bacterium]|nr:ECF transporter S component [Clostridiales bacterium]
MEEVSPEAVAEANDGATMDEVKAVEPTFAEHVDEQSGTEQPAVKKSKVGEAFKQYFTARRIAYIATFTALSFALRFLQFAIFPAVPFLKFDFSDVFVLISGYALGPVAGMITGILKEALAIGFSTTAGVGELANVAVMLPFVLIPSIMYKRHKGIKSVILWLSVACIVRTAWSFPVNLLLNFPAFLGFNWELGMSFFWEFWYWTILFNFVKTVILAASVLLMYKSVSRLINLINKKFDERKRAKSET